MARQVQLRRGTTAEHSTFTGAAGEVTVDIDKDVTVVHDGSTAGGTPLLKAADLTAGTGISISGTEITNSDPDQTVVLNEGSNVTVTGTYPNFTIASSDEFTGTVTSVGGTGTVNGLTLTGSVTSSGNLTLGGTFSATVSEISDLTATATELNLLDGVTVATAELNYVDGVTSPIQTQIDSKVPQTSSTGSAELPTGTTAQRDGSPSAGYIRFNSTEGVFEGYDGTEWSAIGGGGAVPNLFSKNDATEVAWTKTGNGTAETQTVLNVEVNGAVLTIASGTSITMPSFSAGTDYAIWAKPDGTLEATSNHTSPPVANARKVGGFHYAPGGNATAQSGGDTTPQINEYSFWDLKWKPACPDPRGMTLVADGFWVDIYLTGVDAITNGSSAYNVTIADGSSPPKVPTMFGGDGVTTYGGYTWFECMELATSFGKRAMTQLEFMSAAYGTTEETSRGSDAVTTQMSTTDDDFTSKWGVIQSTGVMRIWGRDRAIGSTDTNTDGRGTENNAPNAVNFGGDWNYGSYSGSRRSYWSNTASNSGPRFGSRFACDHLTLE